MCVACEILFEIMLFICVGHTLILCVVREILFILVYATYPCRSCLDIVFVAHEFILQYFVLYLCAV